MPPLLNPLIQAVINSAVLVAIYGYLYSRRSGAFYASGPSAGFSIF